MALLRRAPLVAVALLTAAAALGLTVFFFAAKHYAGLSRFAPFGADPYDAVGSFGFQLALAAGLISLLRAIRRYGTKGIAAGQTALVLRGSVASLLAMFVTIQADAVALFRHPRVWAHSPIGSTLAVGLVTVALASLTGAALLGPVIRRVTPESEPAWSRAGAAVAGGVLLLAIYPESWRRGLVSALATALYGGAVLFWEVWALTLAIAPAGRERTDDLLDDLHGLVGGRAGAPARWLRAAPWRLAAIVAAIGGIGLAASQTIGEGLPPDTGRAILVLGVFTGFEALAIAAGYVLFRRPLSLIRGELQPT